MSSVFISYASRDRVLAERIENELEENGVSAFNPLTERPRGKRFSAAIKKALRGSDVVIAVIGSPQAVASSWVNYELGMAEAMGKRIIPLAVDRYSVNELPAEFAGQHIMFFDPERIDDAVRDILEAITPQAA